LAEPVLGAWSLKFQPAEISLPRIEKVMNLFVISTQPGMASEIHTTLQKDFPDGVVVMGQDRLTLDTSLKPDRQVELSIRSGIRSMKGVVAICQVPRRPPVRFRNPFRVQCGSNCGECERDLC
jgi:hypothetical protein